jgi:hypothetical protein
LLEIFQSSDTTLEGKKYSCRILRYCASAISVPVLQRIADTPGDEKLSKEAANKIEMNRE